MICRKCGALHALRRERREGFFQLKVFPLFGLYPWECVICRKVAMYHKHLQDPEPTERRTAPTLHPANPAQNPGIHRPTPS